MALRERPPLLSVGIVLTAVWSGLALITLVAGFAALTLGVGISVPILLAEGEAEEMFPVLGAGAAAGVILGTLALVEALRLAACWGGWLLRRGWLIALLVLTVLSLLLQVLGGGGVGVCCCCLPVSLAVDLVLFAGIVQALSGPRAP